MRLSSGHYIPPKASAEPSSAAVERYGQHFQMLLDSGAISMYRPAIVSKSRNLLSRVGSSLRPYDDWIDPRRTTQQGTAAASSATYWQTLWPQRFEKAQYVADCWNQYFNDPAAFESVNTFCYEAVRGSVKIRVQGDDPVSKKAQEIADRYLKLWPVHGGPTDGISLFGAAVCQIVTGDLFVQGAAKYRPLSGAKAELVRFLNMPSAGMERNTDDADQFIDPERAYSQVDTQTWNDIAPERFPLWSVFHGRWNWVPGTKYGIAQLIPVRRLGRVIELLEACKITQAQTRAPLRYLWMVGNKDNPADEATVRNVMAANGFIQGRRAIFDPAEQTRDFFSSGITDIKAIEGDQHVGEVDHLRYFLDRYANALPWPRQLMSLGAENINRDVLKEIRAQALKSTVRVNEHLEGPIRWFYEIELWWNGIDPDTIEYECLWTPGSPETEQERIENVVGLYEAGLTAKETAISLLQPYTRIPNVEKEIEMIASDTKERTDNEMKMRQAGVMLKDRMHDEGMNGNGKATNGKSFAGVK